MEITIENANGKPLTSKEAEILFSYLKNKFKTPEPEKDLSKKYGLPVEPHDVEIFTEEDESYVYAAALCPGISKDRIEVFIDGDFLYIESKSPKTAGKDQQSEKSFLWTCMENVSYTGECELPADVIAEEATAELTNGVLYILLPKTEQEKPKSVPVI